MLGTWGSLQYSGYRIRTASNMKVASEVVNRSYCKKLKYDADGVYLVSLNPAYSPIPVQENDEFRIAGVVVG